MSTSLRLLVLSLFIPVLAASSAHAMTAGFGGANDPSLHGATGSLSIESSGSGSYDVVWSMDFDGYEGSVGDHQYLSHIAFKAFANVSLVTLDSIAWSDVVAGDLAFPSNVNNNGCAASSPASMVCVTLGSQVDATGGGVIAANFTVQGDLLDEWSYRGKFGGENGWVISESARPRPPSTPVPEPSAALVFGAGLVAASCGLRRKTGRS